jgi:major membrane immunogen (membrane-anchored lipoprotein)
LLPIALMTGCAGVRATDGSASGKGTAGAETAAVSDTEPAAGTLPEPAAGTLPEPAAGTLSVDGTVQGQAAGTLPESKETAIAETAAMAEAVMYRDGTYKAQTEPDYEGYFTKAEVMVKDGKITSVDWSIYDANRNDKPFDENYEEVFAGNDYYTEQSRSDWKGSRTYGPKLIETQDPDGVDAVSGATWTNNKFKEIVKKALEEAGK